MGLINRTKSDYPPAKATTNYKQLCFQIYRTEVNAKATEINSFRPAAVITYYFIQWEYFILHS